MPEAMQLKGAKELQQLCNELPKRVVKKGLRQAVTAAAAPVVMQAKRTAPKQSGLTKKAIKRKVKTYSGSAAAIIGADKNVKGEYKGRLRVPARYFHILERGSKRLPAHEFLRSAYTDNKGQAVNIAGEKLRAVVEAEAMKLGNRG